MPVFLSLLVLLSALVSVLGPAQASCTGLAKGASATVARVLDAGTLVLHDGSELRLAGVLTPHADDARAAPKAWAPAVAAKAEVEALVLGKSISIAFGSELRDRYGRHLGHAFLGDGVERRWLQGHLLAQGLARVVTRAEDRACEIEMLAAERPAREARRGLWAEAAYGIRQAADLDSLSALTGSFQIVEGRIASRRRSGAGLRLEFGKEGRFGLVALLPRAGRGAGRDLDKSPRVRLRGWLEERGGRPTLDLTAIGTLEVLEEGIGDSGAMGYR